MTRWVSACLATKEGLPPQYRERAMWDGLAQRYGLTPTQARQCLTLYDIQCATVGSTYERLTLMAGFGR